MFFDTIKRAAGNQHVVYGNDVEGTLLEHDKHVVAGAPMNRNPWCPMNIALQPVCAVGRDLISFGPYYGSPFLSLCLPKSALVYSCSSDN